MPDIVTGRALPTAEDAVSETAAAVPSATLKRRSGVCRFLCTLAVVFGAMHLPAADTAAGTLGPAAETEDGKPDCRITGAVERCGAVLLHPPTWIPDTLTGVALPDGSLEVRWTVPVGVGGHTVSDYSLRYREAEVPPGPMWTGREIAAPSALTGLAAGTGVDRLDVWWSAPSGDSTRESAAPSAPTGLAVGAGVDKLDVWWSAPSDHSTN